MQDRIRAFARAALDHAQNALRNTSAKNLNLFGIAGETVGFTETSPLLVNWISGQFDKAGVLGPQIYCDYTGWHISHPTNPGDIRQISTMGLDEILAEAGLFGSHDSEQNRWDLFDPARNIGLRLQTCPSAHAEWEPTAPLANLLSWIMRAKGRMVLHAASLGVGGKGVLLAGPGGSGKSGTTLAGVRFGLESVGDDYCVISHKKQLVARPFYRSMKQDSRGLARVGITDKAALGQENWQGKHVFDLRNIFPHAAVDSIKIKAILLPGIYGGSQSAINPASRFEILQALAPSTMLQLSGDRASTFAASAALARAVPGFHLQLGEDPAEIANTIATFITGERQ